MRLKRYFLCAVAAAMAFVGCNKNEQPIADIIVSVTPESLSLEEAVQEKTVQLTATRAWKAVITYEGDAQDWLTVQPANGSASAKPQTVTIIAKANTGRERKAAVKFTIGLDDATLPVVQAGPGGSADPVYFNDFDKTDAQKSGDAWPSAGDTDCWKNQKGTGVAGVTYVTAGTKNIRCNNNSTGSGHNNYFFSNNTVLAVKNIALVEGQTNYALSFYGLRNVFDAPAGGSVFDHSQFKVCISNDGAKWVELTYAFEGGDPDNAWAQAKSTFTVPAGTKTLHIGFPFPGEASTYRLDDVKLDVADAPGTAVDFSAGKAMPEFNGGSDPVDPVNPGTPTGDGTEANPYNATAAIAKAIEIGQTASAEYYYVKGYVSTVKEISPQFGNGTFEITDTKNYDTAPFTCYRVKYIGGANFTSSDQIKVGDEVVVKAQLVNFKGNTPETNNGEVVSHNGSTPDPVGDLETESAAEVIKAANGAKVKFKNALVVASAQTGYLVTDAKAQDYVFVYEDKNPTEQVPAVGSKVTVEAVMAAYSGMPQLTTPSTTVISTGASVTHPAIEDITSKLGSFSSTKVKYVSYTGKLSVDSQKGYYNVAVSGSEVMGAFLPPFIDVTAFVGVDNIVYEGYYLYTTGGGKYVYLILTAAHPREGDYFSVSPTDLSVAATATTASISVSSSVDWTASSDNAAFTVSPASGNGNGAITVKFEANTTDKARSAVITVSTTSDKVSKKSYTVTVTQKAPSTGDEYSSNVTWTLGESAYTQNGTVNGVDVDDILKLGTSSKVGNATINLPAGTSKVAFYGIGWKGKGNATVKFTLGTFTKEVTVKENEGLANNPPYTLTVTEADRYEIDLGTPLTGAAQVKVETVKTSASRVAFFGIQAK